MTKKHWRIGLIVLVIGLMVFGGALTGLASTLPNSLEWDGQGSDSLDCDKLGESPERTAAGWMHWIVTQGDGITEAELVLGGSGSGTYETTKYGPVVEFFTPYFDVDTLTATMYYSGALATNPATGEIQSQFTLSDYCPGVACEDLTVTKTAVTSFKRTHDWEIEKWVKTKYGHTVDDCIPKIWLFADGSGNEWAKWYVKVTYLGYEDSDWNVSGTITIENTGTCDALITGYEDFLGGVAIDVDWDGWDGESDFTLGIGETLTGTYSEDVDEAISGKNEITVYTEENADDGYSAEADIVWGAPTIEINKKVAVWDKSDLFGWKFLGWLNAGQSRTFWYWKHFKYADYEECGSYTYENTAYVKGGKWFKTIIDEDDATLKINVQCHIYETAYAKGDGCAEDVVCFFRAWGWTNQIGPDIYTWDLWAGAAQCDTSKGTHVGWVYINYGDDGSFNYNIDLKPGFKLDEYHVYAGKTQYPQMRQGRRTVDTVAPGQYYIEEDLSGDIWVIVHAVVGIPDPNFGP